MADLRHIVWLGGPSGSGKTTIAKRLAIKHGLRYFGADKQTHVHHARGLQLGLPATAEWESRSADERWLDEPAAMADLLLRINTERWPFFLGDVRDLPARPGILAEGTLVRPSLVASEADLERAAWIIPSTEAETRNLAVRRGAARISISSDPETAWNNRVQRELFIARRFDVEATQLGATVIRTHLDDSLDEVERLVEETLLPVIRQVPRAKTAAERFALRRWENEHLARHIADAIAERRDLGSEETRMTTFDCECCAPADFASVRLTIADFRQIVERGNRVLARGHEPW